MERRRTQIREFLRPRSTPRFAFYGVILILGLVLMISSLKATTHQVIIPENARGWAIVFPLFASVIMSANAISELMTASNGFEDPGFALGVFATVFCAIVIRVSGMYLEAGIESQNALSSFTNFNALDGEERIGYSSYQLGLFNNCCIYGSGLFPLCDTDKDARSDGLDDFFSASFEFGAVRFSNQFCIKTIEIYEDARLNAQEACALVEEFKLCTMDVDFNFNNNSTGIQEFNTNIYLLTDQIFGSLAALYNTLGLILFIMGPILMCIASDQTRQQNGDVNPHYDVFVAPPYSYRSTY